MFVETPESLEDDLNLARNAKGEPLKEATKADIRSLVEEPTIERWERCCNVILRGGADVETITLWKAVCEVDPAFPVSAPHDEAGNRVWEQIPTGRTIRRAIRWAVGIEESPIAIAELPPQKPGPNGEAAVDPWSEIDLDPSRKAELQKWFAMFQAQHPAAPRGLLLYGPPGTGKTLLARTLAKAAGAQFIATTISDLKAPHVGGTSERIRQLWRRARQNARAITSTTIRSTAKRCRSSLPSGKASSTTAATFGSSERRTSGSGSTMQWSHASARSSSSRCPTRRCAAASSNGSCSAAGSATTASMKSSRRRTDSRAATCERSRRA